MPRTNHIQNSFSSGEVSKKLQARTDIAEYRQAADLVENFIVMREGGVTKRPGFETVIDWPARQINVGGDPLPNRYTATIPIILETGKSYYLLITPLEVGSNWFAVYDSDDDVRQEQDTSAVDFNYPGLWQEQARLVEGVFEYTRVFPGGWNYVQYGSNLIVTHSSGTVKPFVVVPQVATKAQGSLNLNYIKWHIYYFTLPKVFGDAPGDFLNQELKVPFQAPNTDSNLVIVVTPAITTPGSEAPARITTGFDFFVEQDLTTILEPVIFTLRVQTGTPSKVTQITYFRTETFIDARNASGTIIGNGGAVITTLVSDWSLSSWGGHLGYPKTITLYQQRFIFGGSPSFPDTLWASAANNPWLMNANRYPEDIVYENDPPAVGYVGVLRVPSDAFDVVIGSGQVSSIQWISSSQSIQIGTLKEEYVMGNVDSFFSFENSFIAKESSVGSARVAAISAEGFTLFLSQDGRRVYQFGAEVRSNDKIIPKNLTVLDDLIASAGFHQVRDGAVGFSNLRIKKMVWQSSNNVVWMLTTNGTLLGLTYSNSGAILAWHRHNVTMSDEGVSQAQSEVITDISVVTSSDGTEDKLYAMIGPREGPIDEFRGARLEKMSKISEEEFLGQSHNFLDSSYVQVSNGDWSFQRFNTNTPYVPAYENNIFYLNGIDCMDVRQWESSYDNTGIGARKVANSLKIGQPIVYQNDFGYPLIMPVGLALNTTYYIIPLEFFPGEEHVEGREYLYRHAATQQDAFNLIYIPFDDTGVGLKMDLYMPFEGADINELNVINVPHLRAPPGETLDVRVNADGIDIGILQVDEFSRLDLGFPFSVWASIGFTYTATVRTLDLNEGSQLGSGLEPIGRIDRIMPLLYKSKDLQFGGETSEFMDETDFDFSSPELETKKPIMFLPQSPDSECHIILQSNRPLPCTILALAMRGQQQDS